MRKHLMDHGLGVIFSGQRGNHGPSNREWHTKKTTAQEGTYDDNATVPDPSIDPIRREPRQL